MIKILMNEKHKRVIMAVNEQEAVLGIICRDSISIKRIIGEDNYRKLLTE